MQRYRYHPLQPAGHLVDCATAAYLEHPVPAAVAGWVAALWTLHTAASGTYRVAPDACVDLLFDGAYPEASPWVQGASASVWNTAVAAGGMYAGIRLQPGIAPYLLQVPAAELAGALLPLADIHPALAVQLRQAFRHGGLAAAALALAPHVPLAPAGATLRLLANLHRTGYSERQLRRHLHQAVGLPPKQYAGVLRFQRALRCLGPQQPDVQQCVLLAGYYDQAHLTHDFQRRLGMTPGQYLHETTTRLLHAST